MSGHHHPLTCCDRDCAGVNHCRIGGYQCERCGRWFCSTDLDEDGYCEHCAEEWRKEQIEEDNEDNESEGGDND